jgi:hypothetical protein
MKALFGEFNVMEFSKGRNTKFRFRVEYADLRVIPVEISQWLEDTGIRNYVVPMAVYLSNRNDLSHFLLRWT